MGLNPYKHDRWKLWRLAAYFQLLLWWGAERMKYVRMRWTPLIPIEQRIMLNLKFPQSEWIYDKDQSFCLINSTGECDFKIIKMYPWLNN